MLNRQSGLTSVICAVSRSRSQICNSWATSPADGRWLTISLSFSQSSKLIFIACHKYLVILKHCLHKMMVLFHFPLEFGNRVDNRIDFARQFLFRRAEKRDHVTERDSPDHHQVNVAPSVIGAPGHGAEDKSYPYFICLSRAR